MSDFKSALRVGKQNERFIKDTLETFYDYPQMSKSDNQHKGDWMLEDVKGKTRYIECKLDAASETTGNVALELWSNKDHKRGWIHPEDKIYKYDLMAVTLPGRSMIVVFPFRVLKEWVSVNTDNYQQLSQRKV